MKLKNAFGVFLSVLIVAELIGPPAHAARRRSRHHHRRPRTRLLASAAHAPETYAAATTPVPPSQQGSDSAEQVNVENIKEKYWAQGEESELGVVQNRLFSKAHKIDIGLFGGFLPSDPFLNVQALGGSVAYHFNEYYAAELVAWRPFVSNSSALTMFQQFAAADANVNRPRSYYGGEFLGSLLYGKLSFVGKAIIYYDFHVLGGLGMTATENGNYLTEHIGIGQRFWINQFTTLRLDYRLMHYQEDILQKVNPNPPVYLQFLGTRQNWTNAITIGVDFLFGFGDHSTSQGGGK